MRNVTIVESNVEPNKEHLWFYNGKLKWFGPNGWEEIYSQASSPTTTPKPVVPPTTTTTTTTTTSTPKPDPDAPITTTSTPIPSTTTTTSSTPKPEGPKIATPFGVRIYNNLADKVDITATAAEVVNKSIEPNGATTFQILPVSTGGIFSLHVKSENLHDTVSTIKVHAHGRVGDYNREYNNAIVNGGVFNFFYDENAALSSIDMNIELSKYVEEVTTTTTVTPNVG